MTSYDPKVLRLYATALTGLWWLHVVSYALLLGGLAAIACAFMPVGNRFTGMEFLPLCFAIVGALYGYAKQFRLKVEAQELLVKVEIEDHLRAMRASQMPPQPATPTAAQRPQEPLFPTLLETSQKTR